METGETAAQEAGRMAETAEEAFYRQAEKFPVAAGLEWVAREFRADRLARQEQHDELMVMLGDLAASVSGVREPGGAARIVLGRAVEAVIDRG